MSVVDAIKSVVSGVYDIKKEKQTINSKIAEDEIAILTSDYTIIFKKKPKEGSEPDETEKESVSMEEDVEVPESESSGIDIKCVVKDKEKAYAKIELPDGSMEVYSPIFDDYLNKGDEINLKIIKIGYKDITRNKKVANVFQDD